MHRNFALTPGIKHKGTWSYTLQTVQSEKAAESPGDSSVLGAGPDFTPEHYMTAAEDTGGKLLCEVGLAVKQYEGEKGQLFKVGDLTAT